MDRRKFLTLSVKSLMAAGLTSALPLSLLRPHTAQAATLAAGLSDPAMQPLFTSLVPNALARSFKYKPSLLNTISITMAQAVQMTGLVGADGVTPVPTTIWGYGTSKSNVTWPGRTLEISTRDIPLKVLWKNQLTDSHGRPLPHLLPVDPNLHWAYGLPGYEQYSIEQDGVPVVPHLHGGHNDSRYDGNPEYFFSPGFKVKGPRWQNYVYRYGGRSWNDAAGMTWYHDHALGITRLNVYAGLAGFVAVRDGADTGTRRNPLGLPADPYELGFAIQDRMFRNTGELFYPSLPGDPAYADFIDGAGAVLPPELFPGGGPTALAEFFGDHMVVNGVIWPRYEVEPRQYRVRFLNGCDSRFMRLRLREVFPGETDPANGFNAVPFYLIGSDQGLRPTATELYEVEIGPGERLDLVVDFKNVTPGNRVIVENLLGDAPFGGGLPDPADFFPERRTDRVMAFDVVLPMGRRRDTQICDGYDLGGRYALGPAVRTRKLGLFEGTDEFGRIQPLLGTAEPVTDVAGNTVEGALAWHSPITEAPLLGDTEIWEIYNATPDAHPVHVHLVHFEVLDRDGFTADVGNKQVLQHNGRYGNGSYLANIVKNGTPRGPEPHEQTRRDMVTALPGEVTRIKMRFDKPGRYVWHCHILSHEDHEMMRPLEVMVP